MRADECETGRLVTLPNLDAMRACLPNLGAALDAALCDLSRDLSVDRIDQAVMKLKCAEQSLIAMRRALIEDGKPPDAGH